MKDWWFDMKDWFFVALVLSIVIAAIMTHIQCNRAQRKVEDYEKGMNGED